MKLNKPIITICIIILLVVDLIFFSFLSFGKTIKDEKIIDEVVQSFDFKSYLLDDEVISKSIDNYNYPKEVFDYLDDLKINIIKKKFVNNLIKREDYLVLKQDIKELMTNSVYEYEVRNQKDILSYVSNDIDNFSSRIEEYFDTNFVNEYYSVYNISSGIIYYISLSFIIISIALIIILEKRNGFLISSIILIVYSFFIYYVNKNPFEVGLRSLFKYFDNVSFHLDNLYIICFILGFVLLLIYIVKFLRKVARDIRISSYNRR